MNNWNEEEKLSLIQDVCNDLAPNFSSDDLEYFQREFTIFLEAIYKRVQNRELDLLKRGRYDLNSFIFSLGTDEFENPYSDFYSMLNKEEAETPYVFHDMYETLKRIVKEKNIPTTADKLFGELVVACFNRLGFNVKTECGNDPIRGFYSRLLENFKNTTIFRIDLASRLHKYSQEYFEIGMELARKWSNGQGGTMYIDTYAEKEYIYKRLQEFRPNKEDGFKKSLQSWLVLPKV